jgi:hypothetical protein
MTSSKHIKLLLASILATASTVLVVATFTVSGNVATPNNPLRAKLLRRHQGATQGLTADEKAYLRAHAQEEKKEERIFENQIPSHLPIKVKIRAEKEKAAKDLANDRWHRDLEIEVKNTGDKPIYYLSIIIKMPEVKVNNGSLTFGVRYGKNTLFDGSKGQASPTSVPLKPKDTLILNIDNGEARGWEIWRSREKTPPPKRIIFLFEELNFGDGTGFFGGNGTPWPLPPKSDLPLEAFFAGLDKKIFSSHHAANFQDKVMAWDPIGGESATFWPANFRPIEQVGKSLPSDDNGYDYGSEPQSCCPNRC